MATQPTTRERTSGRWRPELIDLSHPISRETSQALFGDLVDGNPHLENVEVEYIAKFPENSGTVCTFKICDHLGTHIDAPIHTVARSPELQDVDISRLFGEAIVLDMDRGGADYNYTAADFEEAGGSLVEPGDIVLVYSGFQQARPGERMRQTGITVDAAQWLVDRGVVAIGCEPPGIEHLWEGYNVHGYYDASHPKPWPAHGVLLSNDVYIIEALANLGRIRGKRVRFAALPLLIPHLSGSPVRAVAWTDS